VPLISPRGRVTITGNCDSAEREPEKLGLARANAVLTHLLRHQSMSKVRFNVVSDGASKPAIQTPPNTREARNRRVEINLTR
jgi:outer membrane protein OmpA-like peptidoglycan-associated protein